MILSVKINTNSFYRKKLIIIYIPLKSNNSYYCLQKTWKFDSRVLGQSPPIGLVNEIFYLYSNHEDQLEKIIDIYSSEHAHRAMSLFMEKAGWKEK